MPSRTEKRTVYAIAAGQYSDYRVLVIFERREDAEAALAEPAENGLVSFEFDDDEEDRKDTLEFFDGRIEEFGYYPADGPPLGMEVRDGV